MDENRIEGVANGTAGQIQGAYGDLTGDAESQWKGRLRQWQGQAQTQYGKAREAAQAQFGVARQKAEQARVQADTFIRTKPMQAVLIAGGIGLALGLLRRR